MQNLSWLVIPLKWNVNAVTTTGTAVNKSKKDVWLSNPGTNLGVCVFPCTKATIAKPEQMATNDTARRVDTAELYFKDSDKIQNSIK